MYMLIFKFAEYNFTPKLKTLIKYGIFSKNILLIFLIGDEGDNFYLVIKGSVYVLIPRPKGEKKYILRNDKEFEDLT